MVRLLDNGVWWWEGHDGQAARQWCVVRGGHEGQAASVCCGRGEAAVQVAMCVGRQPCWWPCVGGGSRAGGHVWGQEERDSHAVRVCGGGGHTSSVCEEVGAL